MNVLINNYITTLNNVGRGFCSYSTGVFIQSSLLIILLLLIDLLIRKRVRASLRYWIWMLVFVKLILPPTLCLPTGIGYWCGDYLSSDSVLKQISTISKQESVEIPAKKDFSELVSATFIQEPIEFADITESQNSLKSVEVPEFSSPTTAIETVAPVSDERPAMNPVTWQAVVFLVWLVGLLVISVLLIQRVLFVKRLVAQSELSDEGLMEIMSQCCGSLGIRRNIRLRLSGNISSPAVCGLINPAILMPPNLIKKLSPDRLKAVLIHELIHIKRGDLWINLVQTILQIIYFYNPFVWLTNAVVRRIREQAVDEMVLVALGAEAKSYSNTLIDVAEMAFVKTSLSLRLIGVVESKKALHQRIKLILNRPMPKKAKLGILGVLVVIIIGAILLPMAKGNADDLTITAEKYRLKCLISQREMSVMINKISRISRSRVSGLLKELTGRKKSEIYEVRGYSAAGEIVCFGTERQHVRVKKFLHKEYADLLRPPKMYDMDDVADIETFANTLSTIVKDVFNKLKFRFLAEENIDYIAEDLGYFVRIYTRSDVPKETQLQVLEALDTYLYSTFISTSTYERQRVYLSMDHKIKTLKLKLWLVIAVETLTDSERTTLKNQKQWIYDFLEERFPQLTQMEKVTGVYRAERVFNDILNGFSRQPMSAETFKSLQNEIRNEHSRSSIISTVSCWSTDIAKEYYHQHTKNKTEWSFPFGVVTGYSGGSDRVDFSFKSEKPRLMRTVSFDRNHGQIDRCVYDIASKRGFDIPDDCTTAAKFHQWLKEQDKGDIYYQPQAKSIIACRGAKMAVLDVNNWIDADVIPTEQLRNIIREKPISRFSVSGFKSLNDVRMRHRDKPVIPIIAVETQTGDIALIRPYDLSVADRGIDVKIRHRFDGWRDLWFDSFITGQLKKPTRISKTTHSLKSKTNDSIFIATLPNDITVELIGICEHPSQGKQWWKPDGSLLSSPLHNLTQSTLEFDPEFESEIEFDFLIRPAHDIPLSIRHEITKNKKIFDIPSVGGISRNEQGQHRCFKTVLPKSLNDIDVAFGIKYQGLKGNDHKWVIFKNVSLKPGQKTNVQIEVAKPQAQKFSGSNLTAVQHPSNSSKLPDLFKKKHGQWFMFPDRVIDIMDIAGEYNSGINKALKIYNRTRSSFDEFAINRIEFTEQLYTDHRQKFEALAKTPDIYPLNLYAQRWLIIIDWVTEKTDTLTAVKKMTALAEIQSDIYQANLTKLYAMLMLVRDGYIDLAHDIFLQCQPELTPKWGWFFFELNRHFDQYVQNQAPVVDRVEGNRIIQRGRTRQQWLKIESPLRAAQTAYADYLEFELLPMAVDYITSSQADKYSPVERLQLADALRYIQVGHRSSFSIGATTDQNRNRFEGRIHPKVLAAWQRSLQLLDTHKDKEQIDGHSKEIRSVCKRIGISEESLPGWWDKIIEDKNKVKVKVNFENNNKDANIKKNDVHVESEVTGKSKLNVPEISKSPAKVNDPKYVSRFNIKRSASNKLGDAFKDDRLSFGETVGFIFKSYNDGSVHVIDFDTNRIIQTPDDIDMQNKQAVRLWAESEGVDAIIHPNRLTTTNMAIVWGNEKQWGNISPDMLKKVKDSILNSGEDLIPISNEYSYYVFKSSDGRIGIVGLSAHDTGTIPRCLYIKYKLLKSDVQGEFVSVLSEATGRVVDVNGQGVSGATLKFYKYGSEKKSRKIATIMSDKTGCFHIPVIRTGEHLSVWISAPGFAKREAVRVYSATDGPYSDETYSTDNLIFKLKRLGIIEGQVIGPNGNSLAWAPLSLSTTVQYPNRSESTRNHFRAITDEQGHFRMEVPPGTHLLYYPWSGPSIAEVSSGKWRAFHGPDERMPSVPVKGVCAAKVIKLGDGRELRGIVIDLSKSTCAVEGQVHDTHGRVVADAMVSLYWVYSSGYTSINGKGYPPVATDAEGRYRLQNLPSGDWHIRTWHDKVKQQSKPVPIELKPGRTIQQYLTLSGQVELDATRTDTQVEPETSWTIEDYGQTRLLSGKELVEVDNWVSIVASVVKNSGRYFVPDRGLTLKDLIKAAGYNKDMLAEAYVDLIRRTRQGNLTACSIYARNLKTLFSGEESDVVLRPHDAVVGGYIMPASNAEEFWGKYNFGDVVELTINDDGAGINFLADLDTGKFITPPNKIMDGDENTALRWIKDNGIDVMGETANTVNGLLGFNMYAVRVDNYFWDANPLEFTDRLLVRIDDPVLLSVEDLLPVTYLIKTSKYKLGILQILRLTENPEGIKIRYKLLNKINTAKNDAQAEIEDHLFSVYGTVTDQSGRPIEGVRLTADCGHENLERTGRATTDKNGRYTLGFTSSVKVLHVDPYDVGIQTARIEARAQGFYEANLCRQGNLAMTGKPPGPNEQRFVADYAGVVLPHKPYELNFVMHPAARIEGKLVDELGRPILRRSVWLHGDGLLKNTYLSGSSNGNGTFKIDHVPCGIVWFKSVNRQLVQSGTVNLAIPGTYRIQLQFDKSPSGRLILRISEFQEPEPSLAESDWPKVIDPNGNPVAGAQVALCTRDKGVVIRAGKLSPNRMGGRTTTILETDTDGSFDFSDQPDDFHLIVAHEKGFAWITREQVTSSPEIRLQGWGRIEGRLYIGRESAADKKMSLLNYINKNAIDQGVRYEYETDTNAEGKFVFGKVPPGWLEIGYLTRMGNSSWSQTCRTPVHINPGVTLRVAIGGRGRPVVGKFVPPQGYDRPVYFGEGLRALDTLRPERPKPENYDRMSKRERQQWYNQWSKTPEAEAYYDDMWHDPGRRHYVFHINKNGLFRIEDVIAGRYKFAVWIEERFAGQGRPQEIGSYYGTIEVPEMQGGRSDEPLDLGELELTMHNPLHVGDIAPLFEAKTLDGKDLKLIDYRGKFVLLSFWQPVFHPELQQLKELYNTYSSKGRLEIIGLGGNDTFDEVKKYVEENAIPWPQIYTGEEFRSGIAKDYDIPGLPWIFFVGPDGKIVAKDLRGGKLISTVTEILNAANQNKFDVQIDTVTEKVAKTDKGIVGLKQTEVKEKASSFIGCDLPASVQDVKSFFNSIFGTHQVLIRFDIAPEDLKNLMEKSGKLSDLPDLHKNPKIYTAMVETHKVIKIDWWKPGELESPVCAEWLKRKRAMGDPRIWLYSVLKICCSREDNNLIRVYIDFFSEPDDMPFSNPDMSRKIEEPKVWSQKLAGDVFAAIIANDNNRLKDLNIDSGLLSYFGSYKKDYDFSGLNRMVHYQKADRCFVIVSPICHKEGNYSDQEIQFGFKLKQGVWIAGSIESRNIGYRDDFLKKEGFEEFSRIQLTKKFTDDVQGNPTNNSVVQVVPGRVAVDWQYIGPAIPPDFNDIMELAEHIELGSIGRDAEGKTFITFVRDGQEAKNRQYRFVLFTKDGKILEPDGNVVLGEGRRLEEKFTFDEPFSTRRLKGFRFQRRALPSSGIDNNSSKLQKSSHVFDFDTIIPSDLAPPGRYAIELDGVDDYLLVSDSPSLRLESPFTIEMWIKTKLPPDTSEYRGGWALISKGFTVGTPRAYLTGFGIKLDRFQNEPSNLKIDFCKSNNSGIYSSTYSGYPLTNGVSEWIYIHHVFEGKYYKSTPGHPLVMGKFLIPTENPFKGLLGEVRLWNGYRTRQELSEYKNVALTGTEPDLAACWTFEQTDGQFAYDISPNHNHARLGKSIDADNADPKWIDLQGTLTESQLQTDVQF